MKYRVLAAALLVPALMVPVQAETVKVDITVKEVDLEIDNAGTTAAMWTFGGTIPGPLVRVKQGDVVDFTLHNDAANKNSHSMDFHAAQLDVLDEFEPIKPGDSTRFEWTAEYPGVWMYHCGADSMAEHISRGMYGLAIVDPKKGYNKKFPKPDREYVIVHGDLFEDGASAEERTVDDKWQGVLVNGKLFHYDPVDDANASITLEAEPGERVRIYFVNAMINRWAAFHPIAGIWERVWDNGNPENVLWGIQTMSVAPSHAVTMDLVTPSGRDSNNALLDHSMTQALNGGVTVLMTSEEADPAKGRGDQLILR